MYIAQPLRDKQQSAWLVALLTVAAWLLFLPALLPTASAQQLPTIVQPSGCCTTNGTCTDDTSYDASAFALQAARLLVNDPGITLINAT